MSERKRGRPKKRRTASETAAKQPSFDIAESPLSWLARHAGRDGLPLISEIEFTAGERLRADFTFGQMTPRVTANWQQLLGAGGGNPGSPDIGAEISDAVARAQERVRRALDAAGPDLADILLDVCCYLRGISSVESSKRWPKRAGKEVLRIALRLLARHYGLLSDQDPRFTRSRKINFWQSPKSTALADAAKQVAVRG